MNDAILFRFNSSYRDEIDDRHTASGQYRILVSDPLRRPQPIDGLPIEAYVVKEGHRYRLAARAEDIALLGHRGAA